jgi:hypothetical protein
MKEEQEKGDVAQKMEELTKALERQHASSSSVKREGKQLIVPEYMNDQDVISVMQQRIKESGEKQGKIITVEGHPSDCLWNFAHAMTETFGHILGGSMVVSSFFGEQEIPGQTRTIKTGYDTSETVPYGNVVIPGLPIKLTVFFEDEALVPNKMVIKAEYLKRFQPLVEEIERRVRERMKSHSIFRGKAINSKWEFINLNGFPLERIVYAETERAALHANLFRILMSSKEVEKAGIPLKRTILLHGKFGTGKTLTALKTANIAVANGWTFMNVVPGDDIVSALNMMKLYEPCVGFFEDIDHSTSGGRDEHLNKILNTVDGLLSKSSKIVLVLTTNSIATIDRAMMRPGRIDREITLGSVDAPMMEAMVKGYVGKSLQGELNISELMTAAAWYTPAFIAEACNGAILYALDRTDGKSTLITNEDLVRSLEGLRSQFELMSREESTKVTLDDHLKLMLANAVDKGISNGKGLITVDAIKQLPSKYSEFKKAIVGAVEARE